MTRLVLPARLGRLAWRWVLGALLAWCGLAGLAWGVGAWWLKPTLAHELSQRLGREVTVEGVDLNLLNWRVSVQGVAVAAAVTGQPEALRLQALVVDVAAWRSLWAQAPVVEALHLDGLAVAAARDAEGRMDWQDVLDRFQTPAEEAPAGALPRFAVENLRLQGVRLSWRDEQRQSRHELSELALSLPGVQHLDDDDRQRALSWRLSGRLDDTPLAVELDAPLLAPVTLPRQARLAVQLQGLDFAKFQADLPPGWGIQTLAGRLQAGLDNQLQWAAGAPWASAPTQWQLKGDLGLAGLALTDGHGVQRVALAQAALRLDDVQVLKRRVDLGTVSVQGLKLALHRRAGGQWAAWPEAPAATSPGSEVPAGPAWVLSVAKWQAQDWALEFQDDAVQPATRAHLRLARSDGAALRWPVVEGLPASWGAELAVSDASTRVAGQLALSARWDAAAGEAQATLAGLSFAPWRAYLRAQGLPELDMVLDGQIKAHWQGPPGAALPIVEVNPLVLHRLRVPSPGPGASRTDALAWHRLQVDGLSVDPEARSVQIQRITLDQPRLKAQRDPDGELDLSRLLPRPKLAVGKAVSPAASATAGPAWRVALAELRVQQGQVRWRDLSQPQAPAQLQLARWDLHASALRWPAPTGAWAGLQGSVQVSGDEEARRESGAGGEPGQVRWQGQLSLAPLGWRGQVQVERLPVHELLPLGGQALPVRLRRADVGWRGRVEARMAATGPQVNLLGQARLDDVQVRSLSEWEGGDLLAWQALTLGELGLAWSPGVVPRVRLADVVLTDLDARLLITEKGQLNLNDLGAAPAAGAADVSAAAASAPAASPGPAAASAPAGGGQPVDLDFGGIQLVNGRIDFTDRFIRPNYSAALSELNGRVGAFRSGSGAMATLTLDGKVAGTGQLSIQGALNPTANPLALNVQARAADLDLAPLSPYAGKYAGYVIERGKMTVDVGYRIDPDGKLEASNRLVLNQLTFGERVESPDALGLPVTLAVALLKDRNGVIDLNLPIGGSVNDPQFSIGALVWQMVRNVVVKAVTAPFSLLFGGEEKKSNTVGFEPGSTRWRGDAQATLDKVAQALSDRPGLQMTVTGVADPQSEREAMQRQWLQDRLLAERRKELLRATPSAGAASASTPTELSPLTLADHERLLPRVYADAPSEGKPRNAIGLQRKLGPEEMTQWLLARVPVNTDSARALALQRGVAVREALLARGIGLERLFLAAPRLRASDDNDTDWQPQVSLALALP